ncbi:type II toxin-antitoxin system VapC family toxin [Gloeobacter violaceus]|uniref:Ribonuclease VapC n=1 Tax=Gloeobacter violaceus (strain ATCC 29082 / PCC 7421) TaxID=251221 RepID=Q7NK03_GLOVI|nr:type II toxin-antitoxin system VapC family toxin [Gloeobacter violaceus]BAC89619.1 glr1678 [Gloeobacter violaceus PCC 7421]
MIILDTNVLSELMRALPSQKVQRWVATRPSASLFTTTVTQAEILYGLALMPTGRRREQLEAAVQSIFEEDLGGRVLPFDSAAACEFGVLAAARRQAGRPIAQFDAQIVAIARSRGAALATRNVDDFESCGVQLFNPWN